jgi:hypothetical protein
MLLMAASAKGLHASEEEQTSVWSMLVKLLADTSPDVRFAAGP